MNRKRQRAYRSIQILLPFFLFLGLAGDAVSEFFTADDFINLFKYLGHPFGYWMEGLAHFWSSDWYRPAGGVVYLALFHLFGYHPLPFRLALFAILLLNMALSFYLARELSGSTQIACWALLLFSYHAALNGLYLNFGSIYDVLGYLFYFSALLVYIRRTSRSGGGTRGQTAVTLVCVSGLYIAGLCCKEMVVTLPAVLLAWNLFLTGRPKQEGRFWPLRSGLPVIVLSGIAALYTFGKMRGPDALAQMPLYTPHFTLHQFAATAAGYMHGLLFLSGRLPTPTGALWILVFLLVLALVLRSTLMVLCAISAIVAQLPVAFVELRDPFVLYIPFFFWTLYAAALIARVAPRTLRKPDPIFACYLAAAGALVLLQHRMKPQRDAVYTVETHAYRDFSNQLDRWKVHLPPDGKVLLINDPFHDDWIPWVPLFLLNERDNRTRVVLNRMRITPAVPPLPEIGWYDDVIDYRSGWRLLQPPEAAARLHQIAETAPVVLLNGFGPPSQDAWRRLESMFTLRTMTSDPGPHRLSMSLIAFAPVKLSVRFENGDVLDGGMHGAGKIDLAVPLPGSAPGGVHTLSFTREEPDPSGGASPKPLLFFGAQVLSGATGRGF